MSFLELSHFAMSSSLSDVTIVIGNEKIFAHKVVLAAASPVWSSMLTSPMKEAAENRIVVEDIEVDVMKAVLNCLYTGKADDLNGVEITLKALAVAEKYALEKFKAVCEQALTRSLNIDNALRILYQADNYQAETLAKECMKFIIDHRDQIIDTADFDEMYEKEPLLMKQFTVGIVKATKGMKGQASSRDRKIRLCINDWEN